MIAPGFLLLAGIFAFVIAVGFWAAYENRAILQRFPTISALLHKHVFSVFFLSVWIGVGIGMLVGHFMTGAVYCGTP